MAQRMGRGFLLYSAGLELELGPKGSREEGSVMSQQCAATMPGRQAMCQKMLSCFGLSQAPAVPAALPQALAGVHEESLKELVLQI